MTVTKKAKKAKDGRKRYKHGVHINKNRKGEFTFLVAAKNGHALSVSSEGYKSKKSAIKAAYAAYEVLRAALINDDKDKYHDNTITLKAKTAPKKKATKAPAKKSLKKAEAAKVA